MLYELRVENLLLMERAELRLAPGLNVLTGETGAGKTLLAQALDLLLGGKARAGIVREGAAEAYVEGVFSLPPGVGEGGERLGGQADERFGSLIPDGAEELVLARRVWPDGRTRAYVCGRSATVGDLRELGSLLLSFYGQHEHRKLMLVSAQLDALDAFGGAEVLSLRHAVGELHDRVRILEARRDGLLGDAGARERELDLLRFELEEIETIGPVVEEEAELLIERERLRHLAVLQESGSSAAEAIAPDDGLGAATLLARAAEAVEVMAAVDPSVSALAERLSAARLEAEDVVLELSSYVEGLEGSPGRLEWVEERLAGFSRLSRKHGGSLAEVLAHAERCRERVAELADSEVALEGVDAELAEAVAARAAAGDRLSALRSEAAPRLAAAVRERLGELAMSEARFEVSVSERGSGYGPRGKDAIEFLIAPNPGLPMGPLREIASGGEMSRVMLALLSVAHGSSDDNGAHREESLLVFDEIDAGIGGHTARAVGAHLRALAQGRQVLCITHLPQVAALGERHFTIVKDGSRTPALTTVTPLEGDGVLGELVRMLGADADDRAARGHARELLKAA